MKCTEESNYRFAKFKESCELKCTMYSTRKGTSLITLGGEVKGNEHLFAFKAFLFLVGYLRRNGVKLSKSFQNTFAQMAFDALGRLTDNYVINIKEQENND